jgi:E3 ubiquitin-protein ligase TRIP12
LGAVEIFQRSPLKRERIGIQITEIEGDDEFRTLSDFEVSPSSVDSKMLRVLQLLGRSKQRYPTLDMEYQAFENRLLPNLTSPYLMMARIAAEVQIVVNFPFLFSFGLRGFLFQVLASDVLSGLSVIYEWNTNRILQEKHNQLKCSVRRSHLFEDATCLLRTVGVLPFHFAVTFRDEVGTGIGPTREFFTVVAREFALVSRGLWRNVFENPSEYAFDPLGLFPIFTADPESFFLPGVLCGKAISMGLIVPMSFNPAFVKLLKGEEVNVKEIDPVYNVEFQGLEGMPFLYPGTKVPLIEGGETTMISSENFALYKEKVAEFTCGAKLAPTIDAFRKGLCNVVKPKMWNFVSAVELCDVVAGSDGGISIDALRENVVPFEHAPESVELHMLFEVLAEMDVNLQGLFLKFVTGSSRLPVGGLAKLHPKLTIAQVKASNHDTLPSATVCQHYFKLPQDASKEVMRVKVIRAVTDGQDAFTFS